MIIEILLFVVGLVLLYFGAEFLVAGASAVALRLGITPLVVGLTVVAFGTSAPELLVCLMAAFKGTDDISVGNIIGSNIANIALILGCASLVRPLEVHVQAVRREFPVMVVASIMMVLVAFDGTITRLEGGILAISMVFYLVFAFFAAQKGGDVDVEGLDELEEADTEAPALADMAKIAGGILGLAGGAYLMVESATVIAKAIGIPELVIGITVVAFGTSLPELATSLVAAYRNESDISVGNVIGSNIFNIFLVLGLSSIVVPIAVGQAAIDFDLWIMLGVALGIWPILRTGHRVSRLEGAFMLAFYVGYVVYLFMRT
ncbi:calcium/sodium antiporter [Persicimonas caeni]|uniref:Calcium/sodium antiporter n=1 Tax=Persicimonas caeni TaxID=2292766 RepID=A0A4Y6PUU7_PERCE|nr:calcium/sodium antiporter [Persicimonas caeni]QDG51777.1 calcium/sodium antiporter [Persicimonas caeni]QED32998.1 calcium/sodium antiporter [Persicimonas caeni]